MADTTDNTGLVCRKCGCRHFHVIYRKAVKDGFRRLQSCRHCGHRISTMETTVAEHR